MAKRQHLCDVPGCGRSRQRWQRICDRCFSSLPRDIRVGIIDAFKQRRFRDHRAHCRSAAEHFAEVERRLAEPKPELPEQWWQRD